MVTDIGFAILSAIALINRLHELHSIPADCLAFTFVQFIWVFGCKAIVKDHIKTLCQIHVSGTLDKHDFVWNCNN